MAVDPFVQAFLKNSKRGTDDYSGGNGGYSSGGTKSAGGDAFTSAFISNSAARRKKLEEEQASQADQLKEQAKQTTEQPKTKINVGGKDIEIDEQTKKSWFSLNEEAKRVLKERLGEETFNQLKSALDKEAPKQGIFEKITDKVNANSEMDKFKRTQQGQNADYRTAQREAGQKDYTNPFQRAAFSVVEPVARGVNTLAGASAKFGQGVSDLAGVAFASDDEERRIALERAKKRSDEDIAFSGKGGLLGVGANFQNAKELEDKKKLAGAAIQTGADLASVIPQGKAARLGMSGASVGKRLGVDIAENVITGVGSEAGRQLKDGRFDAGAFGREALLDTAIPLGTYGAGRLAKGVADIGKGGKLTKSAAGSSAPELTRASVSGSMKQVDPTDLNAQLNDAVASQRDKYKSGWVKDKADRFLAQTDPAYQLAKIDSDYAKKQGLKRNQLKSTDSLEHQMDKVLNSDIQAKTIVMEQKIDGDRTIADFIQKYGEQTPESMEFNNYLNAKMDLDVRAKSKGTKLIKNVEDTDLKAFVDNYELKNPEALADAKFAKKVNDYAIDIGVEGGLLSKAEAKVIKGSYEYGVPLERIMPDDIARASIDSSSVGSIGKQTITQRLVGNTDVPLSNSFDRFTNRISTAVKQKNKAELGQMYLKRVQEGVAKGDLTIEAGLKQARKATREDIQMLNKATKRIESFAKTDRRNLRKLESELNKFNKEGMDIRLKGGGQAPINFTPSGLGGEVPTSQAGRTTTDFVASSKGVVKEPGKEIEKLARQRDKLLREAESLAPSRTPAEGEMSLSASPTDAKLLRARAKTIQDKIDKIRKGPARAIDTATTPSKMGTVDTRRFVRSLIEADPVELRRLRDKIATREPKVAALMDKIEAERISIEANQALKTELKDITAQLTDDPTTGKQLISGLIDGQPYKLEVPPEIAKVMQGLGEKQMDGVLKTLGTVNKAFRLTWTGALAPVFAIKSVLYDLPMSVVNSPQGFKTLGPGAVAESFKSLVGKSDFVDSLKAVGAQTAGSSKMSAFLPMDAKAVAAQKDFASRLKFNLTNPKALIDNLDILGGKLSEQTRTRIAKASYADSIKKGFNEQEALTQAAYAWNNVLPNYRRTSHLVKSIDTILPFTAASIAGTRSMAKALNRSPGKFAVKALALGPAPMIGVAAYSISSQAGQDYYQDMRDAGKEKVLDNNFIIVTPLAKKNDETGEWTGVIKIPIAPEFRPMNRVAWRSVADESGGGPNGTLIAGAMFDSLTGGLRDSDSPQMTVAQILGGSDPFTGDPLVRGNMADLPKEEQVFDSTSGAGSALAKIMGYKISPIQADKILGQFGTFGKVLKGEGAVEANVKALQNTFSGSFGEKAQSAFWDAQNAIKRDKDKQSKKVTEAVNNKDYARAARLAQEYNSTIQDRITPFLRKYQDSPAWDPMWDEYINDLFIKDTPKALKAREKY